MGEVIENTSQNIISGHSHSFDTGIAKALGFTAAVIYNHILYWLRYNACKSDAQMIDGKYWMYEKQQQIADFLEYLTIDDVKKAMVKLLNAGLIIKGNFNSNPFDKTAWYTIPDQSKIKKTLTKVPIGTIASANPHHPECESAPSLYTDNNSYTLDKEDTSLKVSSPDGAMPAKAGVVEKAKPLKKREKLEQSQEVRDLAHALLDSMHDIKPHFKEPATITPIETQIDLMLRLDKRNPKEVLDVFRWALSDPFWCDKMFKPNPAKYLREKFDQLQMKMVTKLPEKNRRFAPSSDTKKAKASLDEAQGI